MSDVVSNVEIEDVLSSIRQLVEDKPNEKNVLKSKGEIQDHFVLTPALRVVETAPLPLVNISDSGPFVLGADMLASDIVPSTISREKRIETLEAAVSATEGDWEPDGSEPDEHLEPDSQIFASSRSAQIAQAVEAENGSFDHRAAAVKFETETRANSVEDSATKIEPLVAKAMLSDENTVSEAALRELIAAIVHEELQGALGERITDNVRRLVRREIQKALALKDFE